MFEPIESLALKKLHPVQFIKRYEFVWLFNYDALYIIIITGNNIAKVFIALKIKWLMLNSYCVFEEVTISKDITSLDGSH